ncbi:hypothetical protein COBT_000516 [Conglomerata obtusa]
MMLLASRSIYSYIRMCLSLLLTTRVGIINAYYIADNKNQIEVNLKELEKVINDRILRICNNLKDFNPPLIMLIGYKAGDFFLQKNLIKCLNAFLHQDLNCFICPNKQRSSKCISGYLKEFIINYNLLIRSMAINTERSTKNETGKTKYSLPDHYTFFEVKKKFNDNEIDKNFEQAIHVKNLCIIDNYFVHNHYSDYVYDLFIQELDISPISDNILILTFDLNEKITSTNFKQLFENIYAKIELRSADIKYLNAFFLCLNTIKNTTYLEHLYKYVKTDDNTFNKSKALENILQYSKNIGNKANGNKLEENYTSSIAIEEQFKICAISETDKVYIFSNLGYKLEMQKNFLYKSVEKKGSFDYYKLETKIRCNLFKEIVFIDIYSQVDIYDNLKHKVKNYTLTIHKQDQIEVYKYISYTWCNSKTLYTKYCNNINQCYDLNAFFGNLFHYIIHSYKFNYERSTTFYLPLIHMEYTTVYYMNYLHDYSFIISSYSEVKAKVCKFITFGGCNIISEKYTKSRGKLLGIESRIHDKWIDFTSKKKDVNYNKNMLNFLIPYFTSLCDTKDRLFSENLHEDCDDMNTIVVKIHYNTGGETSTYYIIISLYMELYYRIVSNYSFSSTIVKTCKMLRANEILVLLKHLFLFEVMLDKENVHISKKIYAVFNHIINNVSNQKLCVFILYPDFASSYIQFHVCIFYLIVCCKLDLSSKHWYIKNLLAIDFCEDFKESNELKYFKFDFKRRDNGIERDHSLVYEKTSEFVEFFLYFIYNLPFDVKNKRLFNYFTEKIISSHLIINTEVNLVYIAERITRVFFKSVASEIMSLNDRSDKIFVGVFSDSNYIINNQAKNIMEVLTN